MATDKTRGVDNSHFAVQYFPLAGLDFGDESHMVRHVDSVVQQGLVGADLGLCFAILIDHSLESFCPAWWCNRASWLLSARVVPNGNVVRNPWMA
ncbi:hypothetical protein L3X38_041990 [Prunus dulcis]|uniref:Uncharacterized protein n=1 Tax=Prunus dulcis TaxID=3755 RepID=A0AAD4YKT2_PRUDU|nr:hypothetical protein L3X38_041990 [Prunus dulcis]